MSSRIFPESLDAGEILRRQEEMDLARQRLQEKYDRAAREAAEQQKLVKLYLKLVKTKAKQNFIQRKNKKYKKCQQK